MYLFIRRCCVVSIALASQNLLAQPAIFQDGVLSIPQGAALISGEPAYYNDIQLQSDIEGNFTLLAAQQANLVVVNTVQIIVAESFPVQVSVTVSGNLSVPCVELQTPATIRTGTLFSVVLAETSLGPAESCIAIVQPFFDQNIKLDVDGLPTGTYTVSVNGIEAEFTL
ncbi:MAG: hypothetical protein COB20_13120 [SAR86 cluster bacterium]|uniref:Uncharacterized protein n=1 Tax=SAR86 cluster bacterium TaxID=2030880 RepID=A0A2A4WYG3_9GAMM|nr:MAG: hypothetical protein COB20_13120 [SAR86 cluster bacterium]